MSDNASSNKGVPADMNDSERREQMLREAFSSDASDDVTENTQQTESPTPVKGKPANRNVANRFKRNATPTTPAPQGSSKGKEPVPNPPVYEKGSAVDSTNGITIEGTNIGSRASEPNWTNQQLQHIADLCGKRLGHVMMSETRRSIPDPENKYLAIANDGSVVTKGPAILPNIGWSDFKLGLGKVKPDEKTGKSKLYSDVVMKGPNWVLSQWTSKDVVLEGVADNILDKPPRLTNGRPDRRIGHDFARIGLPKTSFGPIFETLKTVFPSIVDDISITKGYYWLNASWGVTGSPGRFIYTGPNKIRDNTFKLYEAMKMISGYSSIGAGAIAISVANESEMRGGKLVPANNKFELSVKIHNMFHMRKVAYHSPPQAASTGFEVTDDMYDETESLEPVSNIGTMMTDTASAFSNSTANPFFGSLGSVTGNALPGQNNTTLLV